MSSYENRLIAGARNSSAENANKRGNEKNCDKIEITDVDKKMKMGDDAEYEDYVKRKMLELEASFLHVDNKLEAFIKTRDDLNKELLQLRKESELIIKDTNELKSRVMN